MGSQKKDNNMDRKIDYSRHNAMGWLIGCLQQPDRRRPVGPQSCKTAYGCRKRKVIRKKNQKRIKKKSSSFTFTPRYTRVNVKVKV
jgi:hypothetical protein